MKKIKKLVVITGLALCVGICVIFIYLFPYVDRLITVGNHKVFVQERKNAQQWQQGLSGREGLCSRCGMLFLFPEKKQRGFWMKDMKFDIDIFWLDNGKIVHIEQNVSHKTPERVYRPQQEVDAVLELPAGTATRWGITTQSYIEL